MAAGIDTAEQRVFAGSVGKTGQVEAAFAIQGAWHGLGTVTATAVNLLTLFLAAGLDWTVSLAEAFSEWMDSDGVLQRIPLPGTHITRRDDTGAVLGIVSTKYPVFQNRDGLNLLMEVFGDEPVAESMFALDGGRRIVMAVNLGRDSIALTKTRKDEHDLFLLLTFGHNGKEGITATLVKTRVVCQNTLRLALQEKGEENITIRHSSKTGDRVAALVAVLKQAREANELMNGRLTSLVKSKMTAEQRSAFFEEIVDRVRPQDRKALKLAEAALRKALTPVTSSTNTVDLAAVLAATAGGDIASKVMNEQGEDTALIERRRQEVRDALQSAWEWETVTNKVPGHSAYAVFQAASSYAEHYGTYRGSPQDRAEAEFDSRIYGKAAEIKSGAMDLLDVILSAPASAATAN